MDAQQARMLKKVSQGKAVLFLGAGTSFASKCPLGDQLANMVRQEFLSGASLQTSDLLDVCGIVLDTPGVDRSALEDFIRVKLDAQPSPAHKNLCLIPWQALFTTNFDDLVETAYRITQDRRQRCEPVYGRNFSRSQSDYMEVVRLFKLMGSVTGTDGESRMALSRSDYNRKLRQRGDLFRLLYDFVKDGTIIYAGYSFRDRLARDIIDEVADEVGLDRLPWGWALLPDCDSATEQLLRQRKIIPIPLTFENFIDAVLKAAPEPSTSGYVSGTTITVARTPVDIPETDLGMYLKQFDFLHDGKYAQLSSDEGVAKRDFLENKLDPWIGITRGWAFRRSAAQELRSELRKHMKRALERESPIVLLTGPAGSGKTTLARLTAYEIYKDDGLPCIFLRHEREHVDFLVIDSFVRYLIRSIAITPTPPARLPLLIVVDEAGTKKQDLRRLSQYMSSRGIPAVLLAIARENEWGVAQLEQPIRTVGEVSLPDTFAKDKNEAALLVAHIRSLGVLVSAQDDVYWTRRIEAEYQNSFQTTLYYLAEPTRPPLSQSIENEYDRLTSLAKEAYRYVCTLYQFGISLDLELLARSLGRSYEDFIESVYDPASKGVIIDEMDTPGTIRFRARSRMVAGLMVQHMYSDSSQWVLDLQKIIASHLPQNVNEVETLRTVLIRLGRQVGSQSGLPFSSVRALFEEALNTGMHDSATLHHFALLLLESGEFVSAQQYMSEAIAVIDDPRELSHFKSASRQHLYNSMGMVAARYGLHLDRKLDKDGAEKQFMQAVDYFRSARVGFFPNSYPFYSESWMFYTRARNSTGSMRFEFLARALQVLDESDGNVAEDEKASLREMEAKIVQYLGSIPNLDGSLADLAKQGAIAGQYLQARLAAGLYSSGYDVRSAYSIVSAALETSPDHIPCLRLASRLYPKIYPGDWEGWWKLLKRRYQLEGGQGECGLLFSLGYAACQLGKYAEAAQFFEELDAESTGSPLRSGIVQVVKDGDSERRFTGIVGGVPSRFEAWIRSDLIGREIKCVPVKQKFTIATGQTITFSLGLNYRGLLAIELRPT